METRNSKPETAKPRTTIRDLQAVCDAYPNGAELTVNGAPLSACTVGRTGDIVNIETPKPDDTEI